VLDRWLNRVMDAQAGWTKPLGDLLHRFFFWLFGRMPTIRDLLVGRWLGHPLHAVLTDAPIGILFLSLVFDVLRMPEAAGWAMAVGILAMLGAALAGFADYADTDGKARERATLHSTLMVVALVGYLLSLMLRIGPPGFGFLDLPAGFITSLASFLVLSAGAYVGGDVVYVLGNMVSRHAFRGAGTKWIALEPAELDDGKIPEGRPIKARLGINHLVLVRQGEQMLALHDVCAHAGGPLDEGKLVDGALECPWHGSRYRMTDGYVLRGPSVYHQPAYEVRPKDGGGWEARRQAK
jgi:nitrite reductase/ring-hydroxylating ferredoxin subunit/uncharacterized membrane protein